MANVCKYKGIVKGKKNACYAFFGSMPCLDNKEMIEEYGTNDDYCINFEGDCKWSVDAYCSPWEGSFPVQIPEEPAEALEKGFDFWNYTVREKSKMFNVEVLCNSADAEDYDHHYGPTEYFVHFMNGSSLDENCPEELRIPTGYQDDQFDNPEETDFVLNMSNENNKVITFGRYPQVSEDSVEPIEWIILWEDNTSQLLISKYVLDEYDDPDFEDYSYKRKDYFWEHCKCREWLNDDFYNKAFSEEEKEQIVKSHLINEPNPEYDTDGGPDTYDNVFLLSISEVNKYFYSDNARATKATQYAISKGAFNDKYDVSMWCLRDPGYSEGLRAYVSDDGYSHDIGEVDVDGWEFDRNSIRPAIRIKK